MGAAGNALGLPHRSRVKGRAEDLFLSGRERIRAKGRCRVSLGRVDGMTVKHRMQR